jgi:hypothetical protein
MVRKHQASAASPWHAGCQPARSERQPGHESDEPASGLRGELGAHVPPVDVYRRALAGARDLDQSVATREQVGTVGQDLDDR